MKMTRKSRSKVSATLSEVKKFLAKKELDPETERLAMDLMAEAMFKYLRETGQLRKVDQKVS